MEECKDKDSDEACELYESLGEEYLEFGDFENSLENHEKSLKLKLKKEKKNFESIVKSYLRLGYIYQHKQAKNIVEAKKNLNEAELIVKNELGVEKNDSASDVFYNLGEFFNNEGDLINAKNYHEKALKIRLGLDHIGDDHILTAASHFSLGTIERLNNNLEKSTEHLKLAREIYVKMYYDNYPQICEINTEIGKTLVLQSKYYESLEYFEVAEQKLRCWNSETNDLDLDLASIYSQLGNVYNNIKDYEKSEKFHKRSLDLYIKKKGDNANDIEIGICHNNLGLAYKNLNQNENAIKEFQNALANFTSKKNNSLIANCNMNMGVYYLGLNQTREAKEFLMSALNLKKDKNDLELADIYYNLGCLEQSLKRASDIAIDFFEKSVKIREIYYKDQDHFDIAAIYLNLGQIALEKNANESALSNFKKVLSIYRRLYSKNDIFSSEFAQNTGEDYLKKAEYDNAIFFFQTSCRG